MALWPLQQLRFFETVKPMLHEAKCAAFWLYGTAFWEICQTRNCIVSIKKRDQAFTCPGVFVLFGFSPGLLRLPVVVAGPLIQARVRAGAAVAQLTFTAADDWVLCVDLLRALEPFFPRALRVAPPVAILPAGIHVHNDQQQSYNPSDKRRQTSCPHSRQGAIPLVQPGAPGGGPLWVGAVQGGEGGEMMEPQTTWVIC